MVDRTLLSLRKSLISWPALLNQLPTSSQKLPPDKLPFLAMYLSIASLKPLIFNNFFFWASVITIFGFPYPWDDNPELATAKAGANSSKPGIIDVTAVPTSASVDRTLLSLRKSLISWPAWLNQFPISSQKLPPDKLPCLALYLSIASLNPLIFNNFFFWASVITIFGLPYPCEDPHIQQPPWKLSNKCDCNETPNFPTSPASDIAFLRGDFSLTSLDSGLAYLPIVWYRISSSLRYIR